MVLLVAEVFSVELDGANGAYNKSITGHSVPLFLSLSFDIVSVVQSNQC